MKTYRDGLIDAMSVMYKHISDVETVRRVAGIIHSAYIAPLETLEESYEQVEKMDEFTPHGV